MARRAINQLAQHLLAFKAATSGPFSIEKKKSQVREGGTEKVSEWKSTVPKDQERFQVRRSLNECCPSLTLGELEERKASIRAAALCFNLATASLSPPLLHKSPAIAGERSSIEVEHTACKIKYQSTQDPLQTRLRVLEHSWRTLMFMFGHSPIVFTHCFFTRCRCITSWPELKPRLLTFRIVTLHPPLLANTYSFTKKFANSYTTVISGESILLTIEDNIPRPQDLNGMSQETPKYG